MNTTYQSNLPGEAQPTHLNVVFIDQTKDSVDAARLAAETRLTDELNERGGFLGRIYNGVIKGNLLREYYTLRYQRDAQERIDHENSVLLYDADEAGRARAEQSLIDRFQSDYDNETVIHEDAGERRDIVGPQSDLANEVKRLIRENVSGQLSDDALEEEKGRVLQAFSEHSDEYKGLFQQGKARIDNIADIASAIRSAIAHGESLDVAIDNLQITVGEARTNVRTEVKYNKVDQAIEKLQKTRIGSLVGPEVIATATTLAMSLLRIGSHRAVGAALMTLTPAAAAALWAGVRENKRTKDERTQHSREMAQGKTFEEGARRREQMEAARYETVSAQILIDELSGRFSQDSEWQSDDEIRDAFATLASVEARVKYSDRSKVDLIDYSSVEAIGDERFALDIARAEAKTIAQARLDITTRQRLGFDENEPVSDIISRDAQMYLDSEILTDISAKDEAFRRLKRTRVATAALTGAITGLAFGAITQEGIAALDSSREGLVEQLWQHNTDLLNGQQHNTLLYGLIHGDTLAGTSRAPSGNYTSYFNNHLHIPDDYKVIEQNGELQITDPTGKILVEHVPIGQDGSLDQSSLDTLKTVGIDVDTQTNKIGTYFTEDKLKVRDYIKANRDEFTHIKRDYWYDNDTPKPVFDKNELGLWKGGVDNSGITKSGDYSYTIANMTQGGSFHDGRSVSWSELAQDGKLKAALSISRGTQTDVLMVDIKSDGSIRIDPDSEAGKLFANNNGEIRFKGAYMEIVEVGDTKGGATHVRPLATITGEKSIKTLVDRVSHDKFETIHKLTPPDYEIAAPGSFTEMAPVIPMIARKPLESLAASVAGGEGYYGAYGSVESRAERERMERERSPRLVQNPEAQLNPRQELNWYREQIIKRRGQKTVDEITASIDAIPELRRVDSNLKSIITVPVAATQEADNIYHTLSLYGQQDKEALESSVVLINLNWLDTAVGDSTKEKEIQKTRDEIERARRDFPDLKVAVAENQYNAEESKRTGGVIGYVASDLLDTALLTIQRRMDSGDISDDHEVLVIRNDADMQGMSRHWLSQFHKTFDSNPETDIFKGVTRFGVRTAEKFPGFGIVTSLSSALSLAQSARGSAHTGGANFGTRASTIAAIGGLGDLRGQFTGAGSDDVSIGRRVSHARRSNNSYKASPFSGKKKPSNNSYNSYSNSDEVDTHDRKIAHAVIGANIDTNPDRLLPYYLQGRSFQSAWDGKGFSGGEGGYRPRNQGSVVIGTQEKEATDETSNLYRFVETNISKEISWSDPRDVRRVLAMYFGGVAGGYVITGTGPNTQFKLTVAGKEYLKNRIERESNGRFGSYGMRKMRQLYGVAPGKRKPIPTRSPLVSPL